ncbi:MAG: glycosyltransferase family 4 protein [Solirubrobacteraceae bacterium]
MAATPVLLVHSSSGRYGADRQLALLATGLHPDRYEPIVVLPASGELADDLLTAGVQVLIRPLAVLRRELLSPRGVASLPPALARDAAALGSLIRRRRIRLVHSNTSVVLGGAAAAALARVPHVWHVREIYSRYGAAWPAYRRVLETARALPCVSRATAAQFGGSPRAVVIEDGLAVDAARAPRAQARRTLGLDPVAPVIAVLGRISDWKGQDVLVRALAEPALRERGAIGLIAGAPWPGAEDRLERVVELAQRLGVSDRVRMVGFRSDVESVYGAADVVAVPSTQPDPLPGAAIEAAAAGCAVVASAHGGLPEILRNGETGRLVTPGDAAELAAVVAELLDDDRERARLGSSAAADVRGRFASARQIEKIQSLYDAVREARGLKSRSRRRSG